MVSYGLRMLATSWQHTWKVRVMSDADTTTIAQPLLPDGRQVLTVADLDGRSRPARRTKELVGSFTAALGGDAAPHQRIAIRRAAELTAIAEQSRALHLAGQCSVDDVVRADGVAARAVRALRLPTGPPKPSVPSAQEWLAGFKGAAADAPAAEQTATAPETDEPSPGPASQLGAA